MIYPFTIDTIVSVSYLQDDNFDNEKTNTDTSKVFTFHPRKELIITNQNRIPLINKLISVYYSKMITKILMYIKPIDKDSLFIRRSDEIALEFVINDRIKQGDTDNGLQTFKDVCNHFKFVKYLIENSDDLHYEKLTDVDFNDESKLTKLIQNINYRTVHKDVFGVLPTLTCEQETKSISMLNEPKLYNGIRYITGAINEEDSCACWFTSTQFNVDITSSCLTNGYLVEEVDDHTESLYDVYVHDRYIKHIYAQAIPITVNGIVGIDGHELKGIYNIGNQYTIPVMFADWGDTDAVFHKYVDMLLERYHQLDISEAEHLQPEQAFTLQPDTLYSFNINTTVLRIIEHELLRLNLPYVFIRSEDNESLHYLIISDGIDRHLDYLRHVYQIDDDDTVVIQIEELYQGSLADSTQIKGKGILITEQYKEHFATILYGILKGVYL